MSTISAPRARNRNIRIGAVVAIAVVGGLVAWLVLRHNGSSGSSVPQGFGAKAVTAQQLTQQATSVHHPIFWLGPKPGYTYEFSKLTNGNIYVRYLPAGVPVGTKKPYLTVGTYPFPGAYTAVDSHASLTGARKTRLAHGGVAVLDAQYPYSTHVAYRNVNYQVEVYDPVSRKSFHLASGLKYVGRLVWQPASASSASSSSASSASSTSSAMRPTAVSAAALKAHAKAIGHPIYWAGPMRNHTYELSETSNGSVYVRYLPRGVKIGIKRPYLSVATYPFPGAFGAVKNSAKGSATIKLAHGGIGVVDKVYPKSIHIAYPGSNYEIEVFDPSPRTTHRVVASGAIASLP